MAACYKSGRIHCPSFLTGQSFEFLQSAKFKK